MTGIKHTTQIVGSNNAGSQVSKDAWNVDHAKGDVADVLLNFTSGTATILAFNTYVDITHGLSITPSIGGIIITPNDDLGNRYWWIDTIGDTTFRLNISSSDFGDHIFGWCYI